MKNSCLGEEMTENNSKEIRYCLSSIRHQLGMIKEFSEEIYGEKETLFSTKPLLSILSAIDSSEDDKFIVGLSLYYLLFQKSKSFLEATLVYSHESCPIISVIANDIVVYSELAINIYKEGNNI